MSGAFMTSRSTPVFVALNGLHLAVAILVFVAACSKKSDDGGPSAAVGTRATPSKSDEAAERTAGRQAVAEPTGVSFEGTLGDAPFSLSLTTALVEARPKGSSLAVWSCIPAMGKASVTDFTIGDDPKRKGEIFVASVAQDGFSRLEPGKEVKAQIQYRRAGEPTPKTIKGAMVWKEGLMSGTANGTHDDGEKVALSWECRAE
jgi:hypothetical protein